MDGSDPGLAGGAAVELTQALIQAAQSATQAAQATASVNAAQAQGGGEGSSSGSSKRDLAKLIPRPNSFSPIDREQEVLQWRDWFWGFKQYLLVVDGSYQEEVERIENNLNTEVDWDLLSEPEQQRGRFLYSLLGSLVQGRLMGLIRNVEQFNGYEALRQLLSNCQPNARNRTLSLLQGIMAYPSFKMRTSLLPQILKLEEHYYQYEKLGGKLSPDMKAAILLRSVGGQMKVHLNLALNEGSTYAQIRKAIIAFDNANTKWNEACRCIVILEPYVFRCRPGSYADGGGSSSAERKRQGQVKRKRAEGQEQGQTREGQRQGQRKIRGRRQEWKRERGQREGRKGKEHDRSVLDMRQTRPHVKGLLASTSSGGSNDSELELH